MICLHFMGIYVCMLMCWGIGAFLILFPLKFDIYELCTNLTSVFLKYLPSSNEPQKYKTVVTGQWSFPENV